MHCQEWAAVYDNIRAANALLLIRSSRLLCLPDVAGGTRLLIGTSKGQLLVYNIPHQHDASGRFKVDLQVRPRVLPWPLPVCSLVAAGLVLAKPLSAQVCGKAIALLY
jgi:hypothetical protein